MCSNRWKMDILAKAIMGPRSKVTYLYSFYIFIWEITLTYVMKFGTNIDQNQGNCCNEIQAFHKRTSCWGIWNSIRLLLWALAGSYFDGHHTFWYRAQHQIYDKWSIEWSWCSKFIPRTCKWIFLIELQSFDFEFLLFASNLYRLELQNTSIAMASATPI